MKIGIASRLPAGLDSPVDNRFGRCFMWTIVELDNKNKIINAELYENEARNARSGSGIQATQFLAKLGCTVAIAGNFGPSAFTALNSLGFEIIQCDPQLSVQEAVENYLSGKYKSLEEPTASKKAGCV
ncbi:MAG: NifB/NifX family molybdenum-iron cluster-binding protein [Promethearchaeota archaeon]